MLLAFEQAASTWEMTCDPKFLLGFHRLNLDISQLIGEVNLASIIILIVIELPVQSCLV